LLRKQKKRGLDHRQKQRDKGGRYQSEFDGRRAALRSAETRNITPEIFRQISKHAELVPFHGAGAPAV
jgi:hypothetical protein